MMLACWPSRRGVRDLARRCRHLLELAVISDVIVTVSVSSQRHRESSSSSIIAETP